ncbi:putative early nodulin-like protein 2-like [Capsicum annuum]|nr:putative early nodulin-like protein 2-like [Capsicum annuum]
MTTKNLLLVFVALVALSPCNAFTLLKEDPICENVNACFEYCENFVDGITGSPSQECCDNLMILNGNVNDEDDGVRRYCSCIEDFSNNHDHPPYLHDCSSTSHGLACGPSGLSVLCSVRSTDSGRYR